MFSSVFFNRINGLCIFLDDTGESTNQPEKDLLVW
jgi:hypothetical protein